MKVTDAFLGEHGVFYAQFDWIEDSLAGDLDVAAIRRMAGLLGAALEPHAALENELLFDPLLADLGPAAGPASVMRAEHDAIDRGLGEARTADDAERARDLLLDAIQQARDHFLKEERVAFPLAERALGEERLRALGREWAMARGVRFGD